MRSKAMAMETGGTKALTMFTTIMAATKGIGTTTTGSRKAMAMAIMATTEMHTDSQ